MYCSSPDTKVTDSRVSEDGLTIKRRRLCPICGKKFTTVETMVTTPVLVIKRNGGRQPFDKSKLEAGLLKACEKRPVSADQISDILIRVCQRVNSAESGEVSSEMIGEWVMDELKSVDEVAYVRFASVHRQFKDISTFLSEIEKLIKTNKG